MRTETMREAVKKIIAATYRKKDLKWFLVWITGIGIVWMWDSWMLNSPSLIQIEYAFIHTIFISVLSVIFSLLIGWALAITLHFTENSRFRHWYLALTFLSNVLRSIPQIIGVLLGYAVLTVFIEKEILEQDIWKMIWMACVLTGFIFLEFTDLLRERIRFFQKSDFYPAMLVSGIRESRIVQYDILWKNSLIHIVNKLIAIFGIAIFLQCSVDFIISVGLSADVSSLNFPATLGSMLAKMDSKKDILAVGYSLTNPFYIPRLFMLHLQGITTAFLIVFTLFSIYKVNTEFSKRFHL
ncbi:hypothetical protein JNM05_03665 [bacterium]|nr:hypothetical protein [bacterium]